MKRFLLISMICFLFFSCTKREHTVTVGVMLPLTGDLAMYGVAIKNGIDLAYAGSNNQDHIRLIFEDDMGDARTSTSAVNKLLTIDKVDVIIGGAASHIASPIIPITSRNKTVVISPFATADALFVPGNYFFSLMPADNSEGQFMADYVVSENIESVGILYINNDFGVGMVSAFTKGLENTNVNVLFSEGYREGETNFRSQITRMTNVGVKAVYLLGFFAENSRILRQMHELGANFQLLGTNGFYDPRYIEQLDFIVDGIVFCMPSSDSSVEEIFEEFVKNYTQEFGLEPDLFAIQGYNSFKLIDHIISENSLNEQIDFESALREIKDFQGVNSVINFEADGSARKYLRLMTIRNGMFEEL